jgi:hypothetical protein
MPRTGAGRNEHEPLRSVPRDAISRRMRTSFREGAPGWALAAAVLLGPAPAAADDVAEPIRVAFRARPAEACPDEAAFTGEIVARTAKARLARPGEGARTFTVAVEAEGKRARGTLSIEDPHGESAAREISGDTCAEVVSALALIAALAIDPKASTAPKPPPPPKPRERLPPPPPFAPLPWWGPIAMPLPAHPRPGEGSRWRWSWGFQAGAASALAPPIVPVLGVDIEALLLRDSLVSPAIRLSMRVADSGFLRDGTDAARFRWTAGRLEGCPVRLPLVTSLTLTPCAWMDAGVLQADGIGNAFSLAHTRPWAAPGLTGRLQWDLAFVQPAPILVDVEGGVTFPLVRDTFGFFPQGTFHEVPAAGGFFGGGLGVYFP